jgi:hypothetical protein
MIARCADHSDSNQRAEFESGSELCRVATLLAGFMIVKFFVGTSLELDPAIWEMTDEADTEASGFLTLRQCKVIYFVLQDAALGFILPLAIRLAYHFIEVRGRLRGGHDTSMQLRLHLCVAVVLSWGIILLHFIGSLHLIKASNFRNRDGLERGTWMSCRLDKRDKLSLYGMGFSTDGPLAPQVWVRTVRLLASADGCALRLLYSPGTPPAQHYHSSEYDQMQPEIREDDRSCFFVGQQGTCCLKPYHNSRNSCFFWTRPCPPGLSSRLPISPATSTPSDNIHMIRPQFVRSMWILACPDVCLFEY